MGHQGASLGTVPVLAVGTWDLLEVGHWTSLVWDTMRHAWGPSQCLLWGQGTFWRWDMAPPWGGTPWDSHGGSPSAFSGDTGPCWGGTMEHGISLGRAAGAQGDPRDKPSPLAPPRDGPPALPPEPHPHPNCPRSKATRYCPLAGDGASAVSPLNPGELLIALHNIDSSKCDMKSIIKGMTWTGIKRGGLGT